MLRAFEMPAAAYGQNWSIRRFSGELVRLPSNKQLSPGPLPPQVTAALRFCLSPFDLASPTNAATPPAGSEIVSRITSMHRRLLLLGNSRFLLSQLYASLRVNLFSNTKKAISAIYQVPEHQDRRHELCLQRTLLAAKTSRSFRKAGVIFVGALLPTAGMHAWIIEDGEQPDVLDREWINYTPLLALCHV